MNYLALARKWRPRSFAELVGQEHITRGLINALNQNRVHHALLFTGTRGVGKTTIARIFAKALNCEQGISAEPCLTCSVCLSIDAGTFIDLIEIDAASRTKVEDTRELLENVAYQPTSARYKIYLIDEVHMLSTASFNALLKTLEEPPEHVRFLLATTDPQKIPVTVLSRCLQLNLRHLDSELISQHLAYILEKEQRTFESEAISLIAQSARGSMRDALSLLDQMLLACPEMISLKQVKEVLGHTQDDYAAQIILALGQEQPAQLMDISSHIAQEGAQYAFVLQDLMRQLHQHAVNHLLKTAALPEGLCPADIQLLFQMAQKGHQELHLAPCPRIGFEMTLIRMLAFKPAKAAHPPIRALEHSPEAPPMALTTAPVEAAPKLQSTQEAPAAVSNTREHEKKTASSNDSWPDLIAKLNVQGLALNALNNAWLLRHHDNTLELATTPGHHSLFTPATIKRIEEQLSQHFGEKTRIELSTQSDPQPTPELLRQERIQTLQDQAVQSIESDPLVQQLQNEFDAKLVKNSIQSVKNEL